MSFAIAFPAIDPILVEIGPFAIRWYALAYIAGILLGWRYLIWLGARTPNGPDARTVDDFVVWATLGIVLGGRLGYVLFYKAGYYFAHPLDVLYVWQGGMSFHGGALGVLAALVLFARKRGVPLLTLADLVACATPIGLFFGRIANFINGELWGRPSDVPWAVIFPRAGPEPRHPSQFYEATLEGLLLFTILFVIWRFTGARQRPGFLTGSFLVGYGVFRIIGELFRQPDAYLGFVLGGATMGQLLSLPMIALGLWLMARSRSWAAPARKPAPRKTARR
ncbi:MAG: prolipoprotein diacylglyceryl transferase [Alphaproteobacteria bacterium]